MSAPARLEQPQLRIVDGARGELEINTAIVRRFLGIGDAEFIELTAFLEGRIQVAQCTSEGEHVRLLREIEQARGFGGAYMLVNGPIDTALGARYDANRWHRGWNGRATDRDIRRLRAVFMDVDPIRPKGISATENQKREACDVALTLQRFLEEQLGPGAIGFGSSGNGSFLLIAIEPTVPTPETTARISKLLKALGSKFGTERVKIDSAVANPARLMPAPGTWKRKGTNTHERPHRMTSFVCRPTVSRVALEELV